MFMRIPPPRCSSVGVPQVHHFGQEGLHNVLVIDLLGPNLEDLFDLCGRKFSTKTVCMAARQMVSFLCSSDALRLRRLAIRLALGYHCRIGAHQAVSP